MPQRPAKFTPAPVSTARRARRGKLAKEEGLHSSQRPQDSRVPALVDPALLLSDWSGVDAPRPPAPCTGERELLSKLKWVELKGEGSSERSLGLKRDSSQGVWSSARYCFCPLRRKPLQRYGHTWGRGHFYPKHLPSHKQTFRTCIVSLSPPLLTSVAMNQAD